MADRAGAAVSLSNHAAIDIGTNSFHLLVAEVSDDGAFTVLTTEKDTVRLGDSPGDIRELTPGAIERGVRTLKRFKAIADSFDATLHAVVTSASVEVFTASARSGLLADVTGRRVSVEVAGPN